MRPQSLLILILLLGGCLGGGKGPPSSAPEPTWLPEVDIDHDHKDPGLHSAAAGLSLVGFVDAREVLKADASRLSDIQFHQNLSVVTVNSAVQGGSGGFLLFDISTPTQPALLSRYYSGSEDNWYTKISPDGQFVFLTANGGTALQPALTGVQQAATQGGVATMAARGIHIVDISDPRQPRLAGFYPAPVRVVNMAIFVAEDRGTYVFASMLHDRVSRVTNTAVAHDLNYVSVLRFDSSVARLEEVARWQPDDIGNIEDAFPHDLVVASHPFHARDLLYVAYWDAGAYVVDVTQPTAPKKVSRIPGLGPTDHVHTFKPHPEPLDGRYLAVIAPETFGGEHPGIYRLVDLSDARKPHMVRQWQVPPMIEANPENLIFSPHEFSLLDGRLYASQFHAGVWVLDLREFRPVATWQTSVGDPSRTGGWAVNIETAAKYHEYVWAVDMGTGILILQETV